MLDFLANLVLYTLIEGLIRFFYAPSAPRRRWVLRALMAALVLFYAATLLSLTSTAPFGTGLILAVSLAAGLPAIAFFFGELTKGSPKLALGFLALLTLQLIYVAS